MIPICPNVHSSIREFCNVTAHGFGFVLHLLGTPRKERSLWIALAAFFPQGCGPHYYIYIRTFLFKATCFVRTLVRAKKLRSLHIPPRLQSLHLSDEKQGPVQTLLSFLLPFPPCLDNRSLFCFVGLYDTVCRARTTVLDGSIFVTPKPEAKSSSTLSKGHIQVFLIVVCIPTSADVMLVGIHWMSRCLSTQRSDSGFSPVSESPRAHGKVPSRRETQLSAYMRSGEDAKEAFKSPGTVLRSSSLPERS